MLDDSNHVSRRTALRIGASGILAGMGLSALPSVGAVEYPEYDDPEIDYDEVNWGEPPISTSSKGPNYGGLDGYDDTFTAEDGDFIVESDTELMDALEAAEYGDVVYIPEDAEIDTGARTITNRDPPGFHVPEGVTLASNRGVDGSRGGLIYTETIGDGWPEDNWVMAAHSDSRITGLRMRGNYWDHGFVPRYGDDAPHDGYVGGKGLLLWDGDWFAEPGTTTNVEVDNCEFYGWGAGCVTASDGSDNCRVHHNDFHDLLIHGLGYGVSVSDGQHEIDHNTFNRYRHAIASAGSEGSGYNAHHNVFGSMSMSHVIDVHRPGGERFDVHHNTVRSWYQNNPIRGEDKKTPAFAMRGVPSDKAWLHNNWFWNPEPPLDTPDGWTDEAIIQVFVDEWTNVEWDKNHLGESEPKNMSIGAPYSEKIQW